jgi:hypothetical protein
VRNPESQKQPTEYLMNIRYITITLLTALGFLAFSPIVQAVNPAPDGGYPGGNTAEGQNALLSLTTGTANTALGLSSLQSNTTHRLNTAVGAAALLVNDSDQNTATGAAALLSNTIGAFNTAEGAFALFSNTAGDNNTAIGLQALFNNVTGIGNTALGFNAGFNATGDDNIDIGYFVEGVAGENNTIRIGSNLPQAGQSSCYIGGVFDGNVGPDSFFILDNADNKIGDVVGGTASKIRAMDVIQDHKKVAELEAAVAALTAQLKEQAAQIQKVSGQVEMNKPTAQVVLNGL